MAPGLIQMESHSGLLRWLKVPSLYNAFQGVIGGNALRRKLIQNHVRAKPRNSGIDIGCGPAQTLRLLPGVTYIGFDTNDAYIAFAKRTYGRLGTFVVGDTRSVRNDPRFKDADIVLAIALLHHLGDEEATQCIRFAYDCLKVGGRFISHDPCWIPNQGAFSKFIMSSDRGRNIRTEQQYCQLAAKAFKKVHTTLDMRPLRIPYVSVVLECEK